MGNHRLFSKKNSQLIKSSGLATCSAQDGVEWPNTTGVAVVDLIPGVGHMLEGFASLAGQKNIAMTYLPVYTNGDHQDWFEAFWFDDLAKSFQRGEFHVSGFERTESSK